jgi:hypothetical protein
VQSFHNRSLSCAIDSQSLSIVCNQFAIALYRSQLIHNRSLSCAINSLSLRYLSTVALYRVQSIRYRSLSFAIDSQSLSIVCNQFTITAKSLCNLFTIAAISIHSRSLSLRNQLAIALYRVQSIHNRFEIAAKSLRNRFIIAAQSIRSLSFAIDSRSLLPLFRSSFPQTCTLSTIVTVTQWQNRSAEGLQGEGVYTESPCSEPDRLTSAKTATNTSTTRQKRSQFTPVAALRGGGLSYSGGRNTARRMRIAYEKALHRFMVDPLTEQVRFWIEKVKRNSFPSLLI